MSTKKKIIISISAISVVAILAIIAVVAVFAATSANVTSNIRVSYEAKEVSATVSANYHVANGTKTAMTVDGQASSNNSITFTGRENDGAATGSLIPQEDIKITKANNYVVFEYKFVNLSADYGMKVVLSSQPTATNVNVKYATSTETTGITDYSNITEGSLGEIVVAEGSATYIYILVEIDNYASDSSYNGGFSWALTQDR